MPKATKKTTAYQRLQKKKSAFCHGKATAAEVKKVAAAYVKDSVNKATKKVAVGSKAKATKKAKAEAVKKAAKVLNGGCKMTSVVAGKKKTAPKKKRVAGIDQTNSSIGKRKPKAKATKRKTAKRK